MKVLLDENIPIDLKLEFLETVYEVFTVKELNWLGIKNGELIQRMFDNNFNVLITMDKNLKNQQNFSNSDLTIFVLDAFDNKIQTLKPFMQNVIEVLKSNPKSGIINVRV
ncbi:MAG: DUF5615 family PIN-like protein [Ignavibacteria bacterium]|nr:DUF5615 family PIN-like protein [Ignavibacteria bacterium]